jgi:anthranilate synthase/aminodeoxychorismate synthase-like glutamine amidotransferase
MILLIDNYDSFVYNLAQYIGELKFNLDIRRNDKISLKEISHNNYQAVVISPGPCTPNEAGISVELIRTFKDKFPILGVCLGHQSIGAAFGCKIIQARQIMHGKVSEIFHDNHTIFEDISNPFQATRYHSLIIDPDSLSSDLLISAHTKDGTIMGVRHKKFSIEGVQFHPESILTQYGKKLIKNFFNYYL